MGELPAGIITFLLTDIEGSTALWEAAPAQMRTALARHDELIDTIARTHRGTVVKARGEGDSAFLVFASPVDAVAGALALQLAFVEEPWPTPEPLRVRVAVHSGSATQQGEDYYGPTVNRCARLRAASHGGQIVLTQATVQLVGDRLPADGALRDLGTHRFRDLARAERVHQLTHPKLPSRFPPLRSLDGVRSNLPVPYTTFIGRERETATVASLLGAHRLITLTGPGGAGKTRLALHVASKHGERFVDGTWLIELGSLSDPDLLTQHVARVLGVRDEQGSDLDRALLAYLADRELLLVLDNCEHLIDAVAHLAERIMRGAPMVHLLATSREPLRVPGEALVPVPPLGLPEGDDLAAVQAAESSRLFVERATLQQQGFAVAPESAAAVATISRRLDGIPLALELAAARLGALTLHQIAERLDRRFELLPAGYRTAPPHQRTLWATVDWSHELLTDPERVLFRRLAVFAGGFTIEHAEAVCAGGELETSAVPGLVVSLAERSLVASDPEDRSGRFRLTETVREYAQSRLVDAGEADRLSAALLAWAADLAERAGADLEGPVRHDAIDRLEAEHDNFREALRWATSAGNAADGMRLSVALGRTFWPSRGYLTEARAWAEAVLARAGEPAAELGALALVVAGSLARAQGDLSAAEERFEQAVGVAEAAGSAAGQGWARAQIGSVGLARGEYDRATTELESALSFAERSGDERLLEMIHRYLGHLAHARRDYARAEELYREALERQRRLGDEYGIAIGLHTLANIASARREYARAAETNAEALRILRRLGDRQASAFVLNAMAGIAIEQGELSHAREMAAEALAFREETGDRPGIAASRFMLGEAARLVGDLDASREHLEESLALFTDLGAALGVASAAVSLAGVARATGDLDAAEDHCGVALDTFGRLSDPQGTAAGLEAAAAVAVARGDHGRGAALLGAAARLRDEVGVPPPPSTASQVERDTAAALAAGAEHDYRRGAALSVDEAIALARD